MHVQADLDSDEPLATRRLVEAVAPRRVSPRDDEEAEWARFDARPREASREVDVARVDRVVIGGRPGFAFPAIRLPGRHAAEAETHDVAEAARVDERAEDGTRGRDDGVLPGEPVLGERVADLDEEPASGRHRHG